MLAANANLHTKNEFTQSQPIHSASQLEIANALIKAGANVNSENG